LGKDIFAFPVIQEKTSCRCNAAAAESENTIPDLNQSFVSGFVDTPAGRLVQVTSELVWPDRWGSIKARWGVGRMEYKIDPGLYALGMPDDKSLVFVSANYKMSFDLLRQALAGRSSWILVLDTQGINVWCAAGKGTFGTEELVRRIESSGLKKIVNHRKLILPQLGAPGVAAHKVKKSPALMFSMVLFAQRICLLILMLVSKQQEKCGQKLSLSKREPF